MQHFGTFSLLVESSLYGLDLPANAPHSVQELFLFVNGMRHGIFGEMTLQAYPTGYILVEDWRLTYPPLPEKGGPVHALRY